MPLKQCTRGMFKGRVIRISVCSVVAAALFASGCATTTAPSASPEVSSEVRPAPLRVPGQEGSRKAQAQQLFVRGMTQAMIGNHEEALSLYTEALRFAPNTSAILGAAAQSHEAIGDLTGAIYSARRAVELDPENVHHHFLLAQLYLSNGEPEQAAAVYSDLRGRFPHAHEALYELARIYVMNGAYDKAIAAYRDLLDEVGNDREIQQEILHLYARQGDTESMESMLARMIDEQPFDIELRRMLGELLQRQGRLEDAAHQFEAALEQDATDVETLLALADIYRELGRSDSADVVLERAAVMDSATPSQLLARAAALSARADEDADARRTAVQMLERILEDDPENTEALIMLGDLRMLESRYAEAGELMYRALGLNPRNPHVWAQSAGSFLQAGELERAVEVADEGLLLFPGSLPLLRVAGYALMDAYRNDEAIYRFKEVVRIIEEDNSEPETGLADVYSALGLLYDRIGDVSASDRAYETALEKNPNHATTLNNFAYSLARRGERLDEALDLARRAIELNPEVASFLDTVGWVHYQRTEYAEAVEWLERAAAQEDASATVFEHLGDAYRALGNRAEATEAWRKALKLDPESTVVRAKLERE